MGITIFSPAVNSFSILFLFNINSFFGLNQQLKPQAIALLISINIVYHYRLIFAGYCERVYEYIYAS